MLLCSVCVCVRFGFDKEDDKLLGSKDCRAFSEADTLERLESAKKQRAPDRLGPN